MDPQLLADIKRAEGCRLTAYRDTKGFWTIGYGHKLDQSKDWTGFEWTQDQADQQLEHDIATAGSQAIRLPEWADLETDCRRNALTELVFNMGISKWRGFHKTRQALEERDWPTAHDELLNSEWAPEVGRERSTRLANYLLTGTYPLSEAAWAS